MTAITIPRNSDGSCNLMDAYKVMFEQLTDKGEVRMVEGSLKTLHTLLHQPYFGAALERGVNVQVIYTGPEPSNEEEKRMWQDIASYKSPRTLNSLPSRERIELMQRDMLGVYRTGGVKGLATHLRNSLYKDGKPIGYFASRSIAKAFEKDVKAGRIN